MRSVAEQCSLIVWYTSDIFFIEEVGDSKVKTNMLVLSSPKMKIAKDQRIKGSKDLRSNSMRDRLVNLMGE